MRTATVTVAATALMVGALLSAPAAHAYADCFTDPGAPECGGHSWSGPLRDTWDVPGYYGGNTGGNRLLCDPFTYQCQGVSPAP